METKHKDQQKTQTAPQSGEVTGIEKYDPASIELKWQSKWSEERTYQPNLDSASSTSLTTSSSDLLTTNTSASKPFYNLMMFPYPSAEGLHVGNMYAFTGADVYGRFKRQQGYQVFEPIGLDGFGIHSENYALKIGSHPMEQVEISEKNYYRQLRSIGNAYDWDHTVETYKPDYYRWTQWVFIELFKAGLAYRASAEVNWCPSCKTVLADEQVLQEGKEETDGKKGREVVTVGVCERCGSEVEKRNLEQWFFRITEYAERLLQGIETIDWTEKVKIAQRNWIGKSEGATVRFQIAEKDVILPLPASGGSANEVSKDSSTLSQHDRDLEVFTTRPDTLHGATFMVISPEHPLVEKLLSSKLKVQNSKLQEIEKYVKTAKSKTEIERREEGKEKTGVFSGVYAINPVNDRQIPIWIADYVLMGYGTGAIMAVPAHDPRDFDFAKKYDLNIQEVILRRSKANGEVLDSDSPRSNNKLPYTGEGLLINSGDWNGWETPKAKQQAIAWLTEHERGGKKVTYHLRDWLISRQRYWGAPIPMIYCESCAKAGKSWFTSSEAKVENSKFKIKNSVSKDTAGWYPAEDLPVVLPHIDDYRPVGTGKAPLANHPEFYETICPECGSPARRETDVSDTFLDSSWYFLRYPATDLKTIPFPLKASELQSFKDAEKRDKDKAEKRVPWLPVSQYIGGAEHSVLHLLYSRFVTKVFHDLDLVDFDEPFPKFFAHGLIIKEGAKMSKSKGNVVIPDLYIKKYGADTLRTYLMFLGPFSEGGDFQDAGIDGINRFLKRVWKLFMSKEIISTLDDNAAKIAMHTAIKGVTEDLENFRYNTAIAKIMIWYNALALRQTITSEELEVFLKLLAPFAPHMTEELYQRLRHLQNNADIDSQNITEENISLVQRNVLQASAFNSIHTALWPIHSDTVLSNQSITIAIQVNGKLRDTIVIENEATITQQAIEEKAKASENVQRFIEGQTIRKVIYVPGKILNFVV